MSDNIVDRLREWARKGIARNVCRGSRRMSDDITEAADEIERLQSALDAALRDAERYRFVREAGCNVFGDHTDVPIPQNDGSCRKVSAPNIRSMGVLDQYIDCAISSERGG